MTGSEATTARFALPAGTVTFLFTDIEGSTRLWQSHPEAMRIVVPEHYQLLAETFGRHGGVRPIEQGEGDSVLAAFSRASDALAAALEAQLALISHRWPDGIELRVRMSLHTAEAQLRDEGNYFGVALSRGARIRGIAHGGQTLVSQSTRDLVLDRLPPGAELLDCGEHRLRDLGRPERLYALAHPDLPADERPLRSLDALPNNLPSRLTSFVGRERELEQLRDALAQTRLLTLTGAGGSGKTRLALQLAADALDSFQDGVWWVELAPVTDGGLVGEAIATAMGVRTLPGATPLQSVRAHVAGQTVIVVLDNCEHMLEACAEVTAALLEAGPEVKVVATSRAPLDVGGETDWRVPPLSLPAGVASMPIETLTAYDAVRLFIDRAVKVRPNFAVTNDNAPAVVQICSDLDGIPLALELAAARVRMLAVEQIAAGLSDRFRLLTGGVRTALPRQQTLRASVDWSHDLLSDQERALFRRLGAFVGGFTLDLCQEVCADAQLDRYAVFDLLAALVEQSLVLAEDSGHEVRYRMLETVRQYAAEQLADAEDRNGVRDRHRDAMVALAERAAPDLETGRKLDWLPVLDLEAANLSAALDHAIETRPDGALRIAIALTPYWKTRVRYAHADQALSASLAAADDEYPELRSRALWCQAYSTYFHRGASAQVAEMAQAAYRLARDCNDSATAARAMATIGSVAMWPDPAQGRSLLTRAVELARSSGDRWGEAYATIHLAAATNAVGRHPEALAILQDNERLIEELGDHELVAYRFYQLGYVHMLQGDFRSFRIANTRSLEAAREVDDTGGEGIALNMAAYIDVLQGDYQRAIDLMEPILERIVERQAGYALPYVVLWLAWAEIETGQAEQAVARLARLTRNEMDGGFTLAFGLGLLAEAQRVSGDKEAATATFQRGVAVARRLDSPHALFLAAIPGVRLAFDSERWKEAESLLEEILLLVAERWLPGLMPDLLDGLASVAAGRGRPEEAARLLGSVDRAREELGLPVLATECPRRQALVEACRKALGDEAYRLGHDGGRTLTLEDVIGARRARAAT